MGHSKITVLHCHPAEPPQREPGIVIPLETLRAWILRGSITRHLFRYEEARLLTYRMEIVPKPFLTATLIRLLSRKACWIEDEQGQQREITLRVLMSLFRLFLKDLWTKNKLIRRSLSEIENLSSEADARPLRNRFLDPSAPPVYLRTDLAFGVRCGGSIGHIAGVLNLLDEYTGKPIFLTTDVIPTVREDLEVHCISPDRAFWDFRELPTVHFNERFEQSVRDYLKERKISFIYQRYSINNYSGLKLARC